MTASVLQSVDTDGGNTSATTITRAITTTAAAATLHVFVACNDNATIGVPTDGTNTYTLLDTVDDATHVHRCSHYAAYNVAPGSYTVSSTLSISIDGRLMVVKEIGGVVTTAADKHTGQLQATPTTGTDATTSGATATLAAQPALVSGFTYSTQYGTPFADAAGTGFTSDSLLAANSGTGYVSESKRVTATTGVAATFTVISNQAHISLVAVFDEAAAATTQEATSANNGGF